MRSSELNAKGKLTKKELAILIVSAAVTITVVSACSPLYPFNPWNDANCFFTLGRGIKHGLVPYRDLYEQKGPLLYFIYALAALISEKSFIGAWIVESVIASLFAVFSWKTAKLFTEPSKYSIAVMPLFLGLTYTTRIFNFGGNAEELCFPLLTIVLYFGLKAIVNGSALPSKKEALICGLVTGALFWIKYTFIGFMIGFCLYILIMAIKQKEFKQLGALIVRFLLGFVILSAPILIYFVATGSLKYLWEAYFYNNMFLYHAGESQSKIANIPVVRNIYIPIYSLVNLSICYPKFGIMLLLSAVSLFFIKKEYRKKTVFLFVITFALSLGFIFTKSSYIYYYIYLEACYFPLLLIPCIRGLSLLSKTFKQNPGFMQGIVTGALVILYLATILLNKNTYLIFQKKDFLAQYRYAEIINQTPDAKILTYDVMDSGFYTASGLLPSNRFFCYLNIESNYPAISEEKNRLIEAGYFDFIITTYFCEGNWDNYVLIREEADTYIDYTGEKVLDGYRLYKRV